METSDIEKHADSYSDGSFLSKVTKYAKKAGREAVEKALWLYYAARNPETPAWARRTIYGALAYFVLPIDAVPDILPGIGLVDDMGVIAAALGLVAVYVDDDVKAKATDKLADWFG